jgi:hypothetical protein
MNTKDYVGSLFKDYEETEGLKDFMEELQSNLDARIASLVRKGQSEKDAFEKACAELGDISVLAKELSLKKRREVFEEAYMDVRKYMSSKRGAAYVIFGGTFVLGIIAALIAYFVVQWPFHGGRSFSPRWFFFTESIVVGMGTLLPFVLIATAGFTFLGLTQETRARFPMNRKRAAWYTTAAVLIVLGFFAMLITYFSVRFGEGSVAIIIAIATLIPFVLPAGGLLCFLILTEKKRLKPWATSFHENAAKQEMQMWDDPVMANRFGMFSGALWIFAVALFILFGFLAGFRFSWVVFVFAVAIQLFIQGLMSKKK